MSKKGIVYLIPTVIADNTENSVLSPQILEVCSKTEVFLAENIRTARRFISSLELGLPIQDLQFYLLDKNTPEAEIPQLLNRTLNGTDVGILSEAGCPGVADPGARAVAWAHGNDVRVIPLVGPSSILMALMASGMSGQKFTFHGYLPLKGPERVQALKRLEREAKGGITQIFMETPYRNSQLFDLILQSCQSDTRLCVARGLTGDMELVKTLTISGWKKQKPDLNKIPTIFLFG